MVRPPIFISTLFPLEVFLINITFGSVFCSECSIAQKVFEITTHVSMTVLILKEPYAEKLVHALVITATYRHMCK